MVRALWTAATGMIGQQNNVDTIANNLANVNTTGYKTETNEFKSLLYQTIQTRTTTANGENKPVGAQVGLGVRNAAITSQHKQGSLIASESDTAFAINGDGFFAVKGEDGETYYTRNGNFLFQIGVNGQLTLSTSDGLPVLNTTGDPITIPMNYVSNRVVVDTDGQLWYPDADNNLQMIANMKIGLFQFQNASGHEKIGDTLYAVTEASGAALNEATNANVKKKPDSSGVFGKFQCAGSGRNG